MPARTFRLTNDEVETIKRIAECDGISQTDVIRRAIANLDNATQGNTDKQATQLVQSLQEQIEFLREQNIELTKVVQTQAQSRMLEAGAKKHRLRNLFRRDES